MYDRLVEEYINRLTINDIILFANKQGITLNSKEEQIIFRQLKEHWRTFLHGNPITLLEELKASLEPLTYQKLELLYVLAKEKFNMNFWYQ